MVSSPSPKELPGVLADARSTRLVSTSQSRILLSMIPSSSPLENSILATGIRYIVGTIIYIAVFFINHRACTTL